MIAGTHRGSRLLDALRFSVLGLVLLAGAWLDAAAGARIAIPEPAPGRGEACVEPTDLMRREHMNFIEHQRDATVHRGIRTSRHSFKGCIDCHAVRKDDGQLARHDDPQHFCADCHRYTAVRIDCFDCHADRPTANEPAADAAAPRSLARLAALPPPPDCTAGGLPRPGS